ncbi:hypothetical protein ACSVDE_13185 [Pseudalkalibacillus sp. Hm43]|uniref:hypothetical protein n=1 Tax=Pseudalkalibacillus sp. Hm43 TaxID=3450742 RepID=UPI003F425472
MGIDLVIEAFKVRFEKQNYLSPFFRLQDFVVALSSTEERISVHIRKRSCKVITQTDQPQSVVEITGSTEALKSLIEGRVKLSELISRKEIHMDASYRTVLKLESIFYLSGQQTSDAV